MSYSLDFLVCFFFFKQKTAYEMLRSLVGSEMCIRDRIYLWRQYNSQLRNLQSSITGFKVKMSRFVDLTTCLLYTSDAADDLLCVDLGGRRIIKKKKEQEIK